MGEAAHSFFSASLSLLAGFLFVHISYYRRFSAASLKPERLALNLLGWSFAAYVLGEAIAVLTPFDLTPGRLVRARDDLYAAGITAPVINSIYLAIIAGVFDNILCQFAMRFDVQRFSRGNLLEDWRIAAVAKFVRNTNNSALRMIFRATVLQKPLMITLKSHKVYVGKPYMSPWQDPTRDFTYIKVLPEYSGYRDPTTKRVTLATSYRELSGSLRELERESPEPPTAADVGELPEHDPADPLTADVFALVDAGGNVTAEIDLNDIGIVIAWDEVESLMIFDQNLYDAFQAQGLQLTNTASASAR